MGDRIPTSRFVVKRCDTERTEAKEIIRVFLVPQMPDYGGEEDNAVDDLIFDVQAQAIPADIDLPSVDAKTEAGNESGTWMQVPEEIEPGTVVDVQLRIVGVPA